MIDGASSTLTRFSKTRQRRYTRLRYKQQANQFMKAVANDYHKLQSGYANLCKGYRYYDTESAEDLYTDALVKCYNSIKARGFVGSYYTAYFTTSLRQNLQNHINKETATNRKQNLTLNSKTTDGEEYYTMHIKPSPLVEYDTIDYEEDYEEDYRLLVERIKLEIAFKALPAKFKEILNLRYDEMKYREICRILQIPMTTVKTRLNTARKLLKNTIK